MSRIVDLMLSNGMSKNRPYAVPSQVCGSNPLSPLWLTLRDVKISKTEKATVLSPSFVNKCGKTMDGVEMNFVQFLN